MWKLKNCPRCNGDVFIDKDLDSWFEQCLQCSYRKELKGIFEYGKKAVGAGSNRETRED
ncbi:hypothetical protein ACFLYX_01585 [Chloroflexota bacterium]